MSKEAQIQEARANEQPSIHLLASMPDERLERKLRIVHAQMDIALKNKHDEALQLLAVWEKQIIEARLLKEEKGIESVADEIEQLLSAGEEPAASPESPVARTEPEPDIRIAPPVSLELKREQNAAPQLSLF